MSINTQAVCNLSSSPNRQTLFEFFFECGEEAVLVGSVLRALDRSILDPRSGGACPGLVRVFSRPSPKVIDFPDTKFYAFLEL